jgi:hypothetical protein
MPGPTELISQRHIGAAAMSTGDMPCLPSERLAAVAVDTDELNSNCRPAPTGLCSIYSDLRLRGGGGLGT